MLMLRRGSAFLQWRAALADFFLHWRVRTISDMNKPFDEMDAREILAFCDVDNFLMVDGRGVWPSIERDVLRELGTL